MTALFEPRVRTKPARLPRVVIPREQRAQHRADQYRLRCEALLYRAGLRPYGRTADLWDDEHRRFFTPDQTKLDRVLMRRVLFGPWGQVSKYYIKVDWGMQKRFRKAGV